MNILLPSVRLHRLGRALLGAAVLALGAACASAQDVAPPEAAPEAPPAADAGRAERLRRARERWEKLPAEEKDTLLRRFEKWSRLPPGEREDLRRRFDEIGGREGAAVVRRRMDDLHRNSPDQIRRMRTQAAALDRVWERFIGTLSPEAAARWAARPPEAKDRIRHRVARAYAAAGREAVVRTFATGPERADIEGGDPEARRSAMAAVVARRREAVLAPRRAELEALVPAERRAAEARLLEEAFWEGARAGIEERLPSIRAVVEKLLAERADRSPRRGAEGRDWFEREFGISQESLGARWVARPLMFALHARSPKSRPAFLAEVRPELRRIAALPDADREAALKALLEQIR